MQREYSAACVSITRVDCFLGEPKTTAVHWILVIAYRELSGHATGAPELDSGCRLLLANTLLILYKTNININSSL